MRSLARRATLSVVYLCVSYVLAVACVGVVGILGVRFDDHVARSIAGDELLTATTTARVERDLYRVNSAAMAAVANTETIQRPRLSTELYDVAVPAVESSMSALLRLHAADHAAERAQLNRFVAMWQRMRAIVNALPVRSSGSATGAVTTSAIVLTRLAEAFAPVSAEIENLTQREQHDADHGQALAAAHTRSTIWSILAAIGGTILIVLGLGLGWIVARQIRRVVEPTMQRADLADLLQLAQDEDEAHVLLQRHVQRSIPGCTVTILNRNNSADRLEAKTPLAPESALAGRLREAEPRSCLAVRSGRLYRADEGHDSLLACAVCGACPGNIQCSPLTVSGEVIGSVLTSRPTRFEVIDEDCIRDSVSQAAPVLANLRNLAIAERRASTDSLTGLPNKRAAADTMKQMLAQASRSLTPLSILVLDLDHFKQINDRFGHQVGDTTLAKVGAALRSALRDSDYAGRTGGEEFVVLLPDTNLAGGREAAERVRAAIATVSLPGGQTLTASVGVAVFPDHATDVERLERLADAALYVAKRAGRDRAEVATASGQRRADEAMA